VLPLCNKYYAIKFRRKNKEPLRTILLAPMHNKGSHACPFLIHNPIIQTHNQVIVPVDAARHKDMMFLLVKLDVVREVGFGREHG
jgi:hypothetical protein